MSIIRILFATGKKLPAHVASVVSAVSPSPRTLRVLAMEGDDRMRMFGLMQMLIGGKPQRLRGSMERIGAPGGVDCTGTDRWRPGEPIEMTFQHVMMSSSSKNYTRRHDDDTRMSGFRRLSVVLVCEEQYEPGEEHRAVDIPLAAPTATSAQTPAPVYLPNAVSDLVDLLPYDLVANVIVR